MLYVYNAPGNMSAASDFIHDVYMYIYFLYMPVKYFAYLAYICNLGAIFVSCRYMSIWCEVYIAGWICFSTFVHQYWAYMLYSMKECRSHIVSVIYASNLKCNLQSLSSAPCYTTDSSDFTSGAYMYIHYHTFMYICAKCLHICFWYMYGKNV